LGKKQGILLERGREVNARIGSYAGLTVLVVVGIVRAIVLAVRLDLEVK
jgi:hypothetical protein